MSDKTLDILVVRYSQNHESTLSAIFVDTDFFCYGLENPSQPEKIPGNTRIPDGHYQIKFREVDSPMTLTYRERYPWFTYHLELQDVPNFKYVYIHSGNTSAHTDGCLLVGDRVNNNQAILHDATERCQGAISNSRTAFERLYKKISAHLQSGGEVFIEFDSPDGDQ